ncbi:MAG: ABC transporter permease [Gemmataceae bacterium]
MSQDNQSNAPEASLSSPPKLDAPAILYAVRWMIHDTFRQALTTNLFWVMLVLSGIFIVFCLGTKVTTGLLDPDPKAAELTSISQEGKPIPVTDRLDRKLGEISLLFGAVTIPETRYAEEAVIFIRWVMSSFVAGVLGFLLLLIWTSGFVPDFLQPSSASVLLTKPIPRWVIIFGKYLGVLTFVAFQLTVFFLGTWFALGIRNGVWDMGYLLGIPLVLLHFGTVYSFAVLIGVVTRSSIASIFSSLAFWLACWGMNYGRHHVVRIVNESAAKSEPSPFGAVTRMLTELGYWAFPKPVDIRIVTERVLAAGSKQIPTISADLGIDTFNQYQFMPEFSILASVFVAIGFLALAAHQLATTDY